MKNRYSSGMKNGSGRKSPEAEEENPKSVLKHIVRMMKGGKKGKAESRELRNVVEINKRTSSRRIETKAWREICFMLPSTINPETNLVIYTNTSLSVGRCVFFSFALSFEAALRANKCFRFKSAFKLFLKGAVTEMDCRGVWRNVWSLRRFILELSQKAFSGRIELGGEAEATNKNLHKSHMRFWSAFWDLTSL